MRGCLGWLLLLPLAFAFWLAVTIANACVKKGGLWRLLGVLFSLLIGGVCIQVGYWFAIEGFTEWRGLETYTVTYPILGWIMIIGGGLIALLGTWTALVGTKEEIESKEEMEKLDEERKEEEQRSAKEVAQSILEQGKIDNYEMFNWICDILVGDKYDFESAELLEKLKKLKKKQAKSLQ